MISLICTKCKATLEMDDAFAGGVCRCQHCGTIQTVPSRLKGSGRPGTPASSGQKALYAGAGNTAGGMGGAMPSSGLDDLATAVASSGISSNLASRAQSGSSNASTPTPKAKPTSKTPLYLALGGCGVLAIVVVILLATRSGGDKPADNPDNGQQQRNPAGGGQSAGGGQPQTPKMNTLSGPHFGPLAINGTKVVYVIDRGSANVSVFDPLKNVIADSVASLGPDKTFQVLFWTSGGLKDNANEFAYPDANLASASSAEVAALRKHLEDISTGGATEISAALKEAMKRNPDVIIIATAKDPLNLPDSFAADVKKIRGTRKMPIHAIDLTEAGADRAMFEKITSSTGGTYVNIKPGDLRK